MITQEEDMEVHALKKQGWSLSAIARHTGLDRKTVRAYLNGERQVGVRQRSDDDIDPFDRIEPVCSPAAERGSAFAGQGVVRRDPGPGLAAMRGLMRRSAARSANGICGHIARHARGSRAALMSILGIRQAMRSSGTGTNSRTRLGVSRFISWLVRSRTQPGSRAVFCESMDQPHLIAAVHEVLEQLGGTAKKWRVDRMATVINPNTGKVQASFAPVAKHYGVSVVPCPPRRPNRKGVVEKMIDYITQSWWRTARITSPEDAQASFDKWRVEVADQRLKDGVIVGDLAAAEPLMALPPTAFPTVIDVERQVAMNVLVAFRGNHYSTPPGLVGTTIAIEHRHGSNEIGLQSRQPHRYRAPVGATRVRTAP